MNFAIQNSLYAHTVHDVDVQENNSSQQASTDGEMSSVTFEEGTTGGDPLRSSEQSHTTGEEEVVDTVPDTRLTSSGPDVAGQSQSQVSNTTGFSFCDDDIENGRYVIDQFWGPGGRSSIREILRDMGQQKRSYELDPNDARDPYASDDLGDGVDYTNNIWCLKEVFLDGLSNQAGNGFNEERAWEFLDVLDNALYYDCDVARNFLEWVSAEDTDNSTVASTTQGDEPSSS